MGLASALSTALTGMSASETTIDVVGNNLANADTAGFKASDVNFATQFLQTQTIGSAPSGDNAGTNPIQTGLGALVASVTPNFSQGTIQSSTSSTDMAIQGDGFFTVQGTGGQNLYTRNGVFQLNSEQKLTTMTGNAVLGYAIDSATGEAIKTTANSGLTQINIPLGSKAVAQATANVVLSGSLSPTAAVATQSEVLQTGVLGNGGIIGPSTEPTVAFATTPTAQNTTGVATNTTPDTLAGNVTAGTYSYELVAVDSTTGTQETVYAPLSATLASTGEVTLNNLPTPAAGTTLALYRADAPGGTPGTYNLVTTFNASDIAKNGGTYLDQAADSSLPVTPPAIPPITTALNTGTLTGSYSYYVTFVNPKTGVETRPSPVATGALAVSGGSIELSGLPVPTAEEATAGFTNVRIYRNLSTDTSHFYRVGEIDNVSAGSTFTDNVSDTTASQKAAINFNDPTIDGNTLAVNVTQQNGAAYDHLFSVGTLSFTANKGGEAMDTSTMQITKGTTMSQVLQFMQEALGIQSPPGNDPNNPIPSTDSNGYTPGCTITSQGQIQVVSNEGTSNSVTLGLTDLQMTTASGTTNVNLNFNTAQAATGDGATTDFVAYDAVGTPMNVHLTLVLESQDSSGTNYRWYADCPSNLANNGNISTAVGTGILNYDSSGKLSSVSNANVTIEGSKVSAGSQSFALDFSQISGLATSSDSIAVASQDGSAPGTLSSFTVRNDGTIRGVFSNGITRPLAQIVITRFDNPAGLEQQGENLFAAGVNSGTAQYDTPGSAGAGTITGGATELSNTDIGGNLVDLILSSTMYQANSRVVTTVNTLFSDLLTLARG